MYQCDLKTFLWFKICIYFLRSFMAQLLTDCLTLFSSGLRASRRWLPVLRSEQCVCGAQGLQGPGRVSQQEGRGEPEEPGPLPQLQGEPEGQVSQLSSPLLRKSSTSSRRLRCTEEKLKLRTCLNLHPFQNNNNKLYCIRECASFYL